MTKQSNERPFGWSGAGRYAFFAALIIALLGLVGLTPPAQRLEERFGLEWLFTWRGAVEPPANISIIDISENAGLALHARCQSAVDAGNAPAFCQAPDWQACLALAAEDLEAWPRCLYAHLIDHLHQVGAAPIVLDVAFTETVRRRQDTLFRNLMDGPVGPEVLRPLDQAMQRAGRVIHVERWETDRVGDHDIHRRITPDTALSASAFATAPFPLPKIGDRVSRYWSFKDSMRDAAAMPIVVLQTHMLGHAGAFLDLLESAGLPPSAELRSALDPPRVIDLIDGLRRALGAHAEVIPRAMDQLDALPEEARAPYRSLLRLFSGVNNDLINFYGPPWTLQTQTAEEALWGLAVDDDQTRQRLAGKIVFAGVSTSSQTDQVDGYRTVFTSDRGVDLSGVEIAATVFANLATDRPVRPIGLTPQIALFVGFGAIIGALGGLLAGWRGPVVILLAGLAYAVVALTLFTGQGLHLPLVVPLAVQVPFAILAGLSLHYLLERQQREGLSRVMRFFVPEASADRLARGEDLAAESEQIQGVIIATDAVGYTNFSEGLSTQDLQAFMNRYFDALASAAQRHGGRITDVKADSMSCVWPSMGDDSDCRRRACLGALEMEMASREPMTDDAGLVLPSRVGMHSGQVGFVPIGGGGRFEFSLIGDDVNTASRIESANKQLGTRIMASRDVIEGLDDILVRPLGTFLMLGKTQPIDLFEVVGPRDRATQDDIRFFEWFAEGVALFKQSRWREAGKVFGAASAERFDDGPSQFFLARCRENHLSPKDASPVVRLTQK